MYHYLVTVFVNKHPFNKKEIKIHREWVRAFSGEPFSPIKVDAVALPPGYQQFAPNRLTPKNSNQIAPNPFEVPNLNLAEISFFSRT